MKFICLQENLKRGLNIVGHTSSKNINLPILNNILLKVESGNISLIGTNLETGVTHQLRGKVESDGQFTVDAKLISEYVNFLPSGEKVKVEEKDGELKLECGNYKTKIKGESAKEFPLIPTISEGLAFTLSTEDLKGALNSVSFAASTSENRVELTGILFAFHQNNLILAATDSYRLAEMEIPCKIESGSLSPDGNKVIVPSKTIQELLRILNNMGLDDGVDDGKSIRLSVSENQILFSAASVDLISRLVNGHYPDYKQIVPSKAISESLIDRSSLVRAVKASSLFSKAGVNDINLNFSKNQVLVSSFSGQSGESQVELEADNIGPDNEIIINHRYLIDGLNNIAGDVVKISVTNNNTPCILRSANNEKYLYLVMPIRQ